MGPNPRLPSEMPPITPQHSRDDFPSFLASLNQRYSLEIPVPQNWSPITLKRLDTPPWRVFKGLRCLYHKRRSRLDDLLVDFEEWIAGQTGPVTARGQLRLKRGTLRGSVEPEFLSDEERDRRLVYLQGLVDHAVWFLDNNAFVTSKRVSRNPLDNAPELVPKRRRLSDEDEEEEDGDEDGNGFHTAPTSPVKQCAAVPSAPVNLEMVDESLLRPRFGAPDAQRDGYGVMKPSPFVQRLTAGSLAPSKDRGRRYDAVPSAADTVNTSFSTVTSASIYTSDSTRLGESFETDITEPIATQSTYADSVVNLYLEEEINSRLSAAPTGANGPSRRELLIEELLRHGPFSKEHSFPASIPLRHRYELERLGRFWDIPLGSMYKGPEMSPSFNDQDKFWSWVQSHKRRNGRLFPEKPSRRAWDAAVGDFKTSRPSEVVVLTGDLEWCLDHEPGIFKMKLNPLSLREPAGSIDDSALTDS